MAGRDIDHYEENDDLAAARWVTAIDEGLDSRREAAFHAWLAARPERAELIARHAALPGLVRQAQREEEAQKRAQQDLVRRRPKEAAPTSRRGFVLGGAVAAGVAAAGVAAVIAPWRREEPAPDPAADPASDDVYETATGEVRAIELADASRLWLDTRTRVSTHLTRERRDVELASGRIFVEVAHDPERPFLVRGAKFEARAIGTAFEATVFADRTGVAVTDGVVRLTTRQGAIDLAKGQCASISASGEFVQMTSPAIAVWRQRRMVLSDLPLDAALAELSRYFDRPLTVADAQLAARRVTLSFSIADLAEEDAARIIANAVEANFAASATGEIVLRPVPRKTGSGAPVSPH